MGRQRAATGAEKSTVVRKSDFRSFVPNFHHV
jgi:hypothetical protein